MMDELRKKQNAQKRLRKRIKSGKEEIGWTDKDLKGAEVSMSVDGWFTLGDRHRGYEFNPKSGRMYTY